MVLGMALGPQIGYRANHPECSGEDTELPAEDYALLVWQETRGLYNLLSLCLMVRGYPQRLRVVLIFVVKTDEYILKKHRGQTPSLIIHLYPTHFRFDQQEGSFTYKSPMRIVIEHLRKRTIPHDLVEFMDVPLYDGCMIVQIYDHKSAGPSQDANRPNNTAGKSIPFSVHNYNTFLTPSSYVPYPKQNTILGRSSGPAHIDQEDIKPKTAEQKDKENMPAPAIPGDGHRNKLGIQPRKPKISTVVLHPTPLSNHFEFVAKGVDAIINGDGRRDSRVDLATSGTVPPTPSSAVPQTPMTLAPPAKRLKKGKAELDTANLYSAQSKIILGTEAPLLLDPVGSATESAALLKALAHPMHLEKPPSPKSRKRTVAEMAADEALAADQERYMLLLDERLSANAAGAPGANPADGDGQAGSSSFEPRFERFKVIENIKSNHEEKARLEKLRTEEVERKALQERERDRLRVENEKKERETIQKANQVAAIQRQQELNRRQMAQQVQAQNMAAIPNQVQGQHAHPQPNGMMPNGIQGQPQRFHQQVSQAQVSSPIIRNGTPQSHSSPMNNVGNVPMQHSTSSMGGSPPRPGSVVHQNHQNMNAPTSHAMGAQRSQQSHAGTPRMPNATPNLQNTPLNRQISQPPRMSQGSPLPGQLAQAPMQMMANGQPLNVQQQAFMQAQLNNQRMQQAMRQNPQMMNAGGQMNPTQATAMMMRQQQQQQMQMNNPNFNPQMAASMMRQQQQNANMMTSSFMNGQQMQQPMNMVQQQQMQQMQMQSQQAAQRAAVQAQAQAAQQNLNNHQSQQMIQAQQMFTNQVMQHTKALYMKELPAVQQKYPGGIPEDIDRQLKAHCQQQANTIVRARRQQMQQAQQAQHQQQMMAAQQMGMQQQQNGMGM